MTPNIEELGVIDKIERETLEKLTKLVNLNFKTFNPDKNSVLIADGHVKGISISYSELISDATVFNSFPFLEELYLYCNKLEVIPILSALTNLKRLALSGNQIKVIQNLEILTQLIHLELARNKIIEIENLNKLTHLKTLNLSYNQIKEITGLYYLRDLEELNLRGNRIREIENLTTTRSLKRLYLESNQIHEIQGLGNLVELQEFEIGGNPLNQQFESQIHQPAQYWVTRTKLNSLSDDADSPPITLIPFIGYSKSGKTTSIESLIQYLSDRGINIIALKHIHQENFSFDTPGKNTWRYSQAGAQAVVAQSDGESAIIFNWQRNPVSLLKMIQSAGIEDGQFEPERPFIALLEGFREMGEKRVLCIKSIDEIEPQINDSIVAISGIISSDPKKNDLIQSKMDIPIINITKTPEKIIELFGLKDLLPEK
jgi:molybdopterin-guanine dinucleotide biosynthesis protein MobB